MRFATLKYGAAMAYSIGEVERTFQLQELIPEVVSCSGDFVNRILGGQDAIPDFDAPNNPYAELFDRYRHRKSSN